VGTPYQVEFRRNAAGLLALPIVIDKDEYIFVVDTGAALSVVSASIAEKHKMPQPEGSASLGTSTSQTVSISASSIPEMTIGGMVFMHTPVAVLQDQNLTFELDSGEILKVAGIIGWPLLSQMSMEIDLINGTVTGAFLGHPTRDPGNYSWFGYPVLATKINGAVATIGLDSGAKQMSLSPAFAEIVGAETIKSGPTRVRGAGGEEIKDASILAPLTLGLGLSNFSVQEVIARKSGHHVWGSNQDGIMGINFENLSRVIINFPEGTFRIEAK
jgi:predicted aspartyl protease